jgi:hypothetical protein
LCFVVPGPSATIQSPRGKTASIVIAIGIEHEFGVVIGLRCPTGVGEAGETCRPIPFAEWLIFAPFG